MIPGERVNWLKMGGWLLALAVFGGLCFYWSRPQQVLTRGIVAAAKRFPEYDDRWAGQIRELAGRYVRALLQNRPDREMNRLAVVAVAEGCRDPFVRYLRLKRVFEFQMVGDESLAREGWSIQRELEECEYPVFLRAYSASRALDVWDFAFAQERRERNVRLQLHALSWRHTMEVIRDGNSSETLVRPLCDLLDDYFRTPGESRVDAWRRIDAALEARFGDCATIHFLRGRRAIRLGWEARGHGYASTVTREGWAKLGQELLVARRELELAWKLDPKDPQTAEKMITVCLGQGTSRAEMEEWFQRGLSTGRDCSDLCSNKIYWLAPRWYGSDLEQREFARECLARPEWGNRVALNLWSIHSDRQDVGKLPVSYFAQPEVWADIKQSFEAFFRRNPDAYSWHVRFAYHAWLAKDWEVLRREIALGDPARSNLERIGGREVYERMAADAKALGSGP
ncbi:MAG: hypothetical protein IPL39_05395 [Opitutaceae bacterium]|nr:hypothetical protein [Opitutaceae bacterium]